MRRCELRVGILLGLVSLGLAGADVGAQVGRHTPRLRRIPIDTARDAVAGRRYDIRDLQTRVPRATRPALRPPLFFERNTGQAHSDHAFVLRSLGFAVGLSPTGWTGAVFTQPSRAERPGETTMKGHALQFTFRGAGRTTRLTPGPAVGGTVRVAEGTGAGQQRVTPAFTAVRYENLYRGIEATVHARDGRFSYGFSLDATARPTSIRIAVNGASRLALDARGNLLMHTPRGTIVQTRPRAFEVNASGKRALKAHFVILAPNEYGFAVDGRRPGARVVIDPEVVFTSYFGGSGNEGTLEADRGANDLHGQGFDIAIAPSGHIFVVGTTVSADFPATAAGSLEGTSDAFVLRLDPTQPPAQQIVYATFVGGPAFERGVSLSPLEDGRVYVTGCTASSTFPASSGVVHPAPTGSVGYVVRLTDAGALDIGTRIGSTSDHHPASIVFSKHPSDPTGFVYVAGSAVRPTPATGDATPGAFQAEHHGGTFDGFVAKLDPELTAYSYFTYIGGSGQDLVMDLAVNGRIAFVTGSTASLDFPTTEYALQPAHSQAATGVDCSNPIAARQCFDAFVVRLNDAGSGTHYSTYIGGDAEEFGRGLSVTSGTPVNQATLTGAARPTSGTTTEIFVLRLEAGGENVIWEERLDGNDRDHGEEVVVDALGRAHVVGTISRDGLSTSEASFHGGPGDVFYSRHAAATGETEYFTYLGGGGDDRGFAVAARGASADDFCAVIAGSTTSEDVGTVAPLPGGDENRGGADLLLAAICNFPVDIVGGGFTKSVNPSSVVAGQTATFTINVQNNGDGPGPVTITDTPPAGLTVTGVSGPGCSRSGNTATCAFSAQPGSSSVTVTVRAGTACPASYTNSATLAVGPQTFSTSTSLQVTCPPPLCPNGVVDPGEECDSQANCRADCTLRRCGDGIQDPGEECDDGNASNSDRCTTQCRDRLIAGDACGPDEPPCAGDLVCGRRCGFVEECTLLIFCDSYWLCSVPDECMPADEATFTSGP
jgi:uncharacterized repeat protein (TIGR01451 family)